jgi:hypothetical protein
MSGHDRLAHHLHKIGIYQTNRCVLCNNPDDVMDSEQLLHCPTLNHEAQQTKDELVLGGQWKKWFNSQFLPLENK